MKDYACELVDFDCGRGQVGDFSTESAELLPHMLDADCEVGSIHVLCHWRLLKSDLKFDLPPNSRYFAPFHHIYFVIILRPATFYFSET